jgi:hypothetical protein
MAESKLQQGAHWATIAAAVITAISVLIGVKTYRETAESQTHVVTLGVLQEYLQLAVEHPELASRPESAPVDSAYDWFASHAFFTAETIWELAQDDPGWLRAVDAIIREHRGYLVQGAFPCGDYDPGFEAYLQKKVQGMRCDS